MEGGGEGYLSVAAARTLAHEGVHDHEERVVLSDEVVRQRGRCEQLH